MSFFLVAREDAYAHRSDCLFALTVSLDTRLKIPC